MKSTKCVACGFVGWSDAENCKSCGAPLNQHSTNLPPASPSYSSQYDSWDRPEGQKSGMAIAALVLGILSFMTFGLLGVGAIAGIVVACVAMQRVKREPWKYGGHGMAVAGLVLSITSFVSVVPVGIVAAIAIPNLLASRRAANEGSAQASLRTIHSAEATYQSMFGKFATLKELGTSSLIDAQLASGKKNGYKFTLTLDTADPQVFEATGVPETYQSTGVRSFYVDETGVMRGSDNDGGPGSKMDTVLGN